jgi:dihydroorotase
MEGLLESAYLRSRGQNSPFIGWVLPGQVTHTLLEGRVVYQRTRPGKVSLAL